MNELMKDLRELEMKICGKLDESEQSELNCLLICVEERLNAINELTKELEIA